jgi:hypothetical protein
MFLLRSLPATSAAIPPVPDALPAINAAVAMHTGHMSFTSGGDQAA